MLDIIDKNNRDACKKLFAHIKEKFPITPGSSHNHQAWEGGYIDHIAEVMNYALMYYGTLIDLRPLPFSLSDALLVLFLHDIEKPWKYNELTKHIAPPSVWGGSTMEDHEWLRKNSTSTHNWKDRKVKEQFRHDILKTFEITLTPEQENAFKYVEGEIDEYSGDHRVMNELAAFCHICDITSARLWHNFPNGTDNWSKGE